VLLIKTDICDYMDFLFISELTVQMSIIISVILQLELNCWQKQG